MAKLDVDAVEGAHRGVAFAVDLHRVDRLGGDRTVEGGVGCEELGCMPSRVENVRRLCRPTSDSIGVLPEEDARSDQVAPGWMRPDS